MSKTKQPRIRVRRPIFPERKRISRQELSELRAQGEYSFSDNDLSSLLKAGIRISSKSRGLHIYI